MSAAEEYAQMRISEQERVMRKYSPDEYSKAEGHKFAIREVLEDLHKAEKAAKDDGFIVKWTTSYGEFGAIRIDSIDLYRKY